MNGKGNNDDEDFDDLEDDDDGNDQKDVPGLTVSCPLHPFPPFLTLERRLSGQSDESGSPSLSPAGGLYEHPPDYGVKFGA